MSDRQYQTDMINGIYDAWRAGARDVLAVLPTGGGKSVVLKRIASHENAQGARQAILAHRTELVCQLSMHIASAGVQHRIIAPRPVIKMIDAMHRDEYGGRSFVRHNAICTVAGVDTLIARQEELKQWAATVDRWTIDEAHHVLRLNKWGTGAAMFPNAYGLGVTATPSRSDGQGLGRHADGVFDAMVEGPSMRQLIDMGFLTEYEIACPKSDIEVDDDDIGASGDYSRAKLAEASKKSQIVGDVVQQWFKYARGKQTIVFVTDVETAGKVAENFRQHGIATESISAKTPDATREAWVKKFRAGKLTVLVNVDLFGEGFDVPAVECVVMARPTASLGVYLQQFGRALRPFAGKTTGLVIDMVSNFKRHGWPDKPRFWTLDRRDKKAKKLPDPEDIELTACTECSKPYERCLPACPHCGTEPLPPAGRGSIEQVDGDLVLLDREALAALRAAAELQTPAAVHTRVGHAAGPLAAAGAMARQLERIQAQAELKETIALWAGYQLARGRSDRESHKRFYLTWGCDVLTALGMPRADMEALNGKIREYCK